jgi:hypothetical protein
MSKERQGAAGEVQLEQSSYEIIRNRLQQAGSELRSRLDKLNASRREVFGAIPTQLLATEQIATSHHCIARDLVPIGDRFLFGFNVHLGLKTETKLSDVFAAYRFADNTFHEETLALIDDPRFTLDFQQLYKYYAATQFARFHLSAPNLFMVFQVGKTASDIKVFKWVIADGALHYVDNRSEHELKLPPQHEFLWTRTHRDLHRHGAHPHISVDDLLFVETVGGDFLFASRVFATSFSIERTVISCGKTPSKTLVCCSPKITESYSRTDCIRNSERTARLTRPASAFSMRNGLRRQMAKTTCSFSTNRNRAIICCWVTT